MIFAKNLRAHSILDSSIFAQIHRGHGAFRFGDEIDVLHLVFVEGDGPIGVVVSDRCRDLESFRQLRVDDDLGAGVEFADEVFARSIESVKT